jgi:hypothetical protein
MSRFFALALTVTLLTPAIPAWADIAQDDTRPAARHITDPKAGLDITLPAGLTTCDDADTPPGVITFYLTSPKGLCGGGGPRDSDRAERLPHIEVSFGEAPDLAETNVVADRRVCDPLGTMALLDQRPRYRACEGPDGMLRVEVNADYYLSATDRQQVVSVELVTSEARLERDLPMLRTVAAGIHRCGGGGTQEACEDK